MARDALGHAPRVHKHQSCLMLANKLSNAIVNFLPDFIGHHCFQWRVGNFDREIELADVTRIDNRAMRRAVQFDIRGADQESGDLFDRFLRSRQPDAHEWLFHQRLQSFHRQRQMRAALVVHHRVDFINDQRTGCTQHFAAAVAG